MGDWLLLTPTWKRESRLCGSVLPQPFISTRGRVWLFFHSQANSSGQAQGFRLSYIRGKLENICILLIHSINIPECVKILEIPLQFNPLATPTATSLLNKMKKKWNYHVYNIYVRATCSILYLNISICSGTSPCFYAHMWKTRGG